MESRMYQNKLNLIITILILFQAQFLYSQDSIPKGYFRSPLDIPLLLSGNFGEMRSNHFHTGLDFKTLGFEGQKIYAVADGYVSRIKVQAGGYGNAIYITHPNGYVSVYGHLQKYSGDMAAYLLENQYKQRTFELNLFPPADRFVIKKSDVIGISGNTGNSGGPHLHFEIRNGKNEHALNPLLFGFEVKDDIAPKVYSVAVYPLNSFSFVKGSNRFFINEIKNGLPSSKTVEAYGEIGFGIEVNDYLNDSQNRCGVYTQELFVDSNLVFSYKMNELDFSELRYIQSHYDYGYKQESNDYIQKSFVEPNNKFSNYSNVKNRGIVEVNDGEKHKVKYVLTDAYQNTTKIAFDIIGKKPLDFETLSTQNKYTQAMPWKIENTFEDEEIKLIIPQLALYDDLFFNYSMDSSSNGIYSGLHHVHTDKIPLHKSAHLWIKSKNLPENLETKAVIASVSGTIEKPVYYSTGGDFDSGWVHTSISSFGDYAIVVDTIAPSITPINIKDSLNMKNLKSIRIKITDGLSGIKEYVGLIDNEWVLFRYDAKSNLIFYEFSDNKIKQGTNHNLFLKVTDNKDNIALYETSFVW